MANEIETKVLEVDKEEIASKLNELGAIEILHTRLYVDWFQEKNTKEGEESWYLRIRTNSSGESEVTWKATSKHIGVVRQHKEICFPTTHPEHLEDLFEELGLVKYAHQEKDRTTWNYKEWQFDLDVYPGIPAFLEIEGNSEKHVKEAIALLNLNSHPTWIDGERTLIQNHYNTDWHLMKF